MTQFNQMDTKIPEEKILDNIVENYINTIITLKNEILTSSDKDIASKKRQFLLYNIRCFYMKLKIERANHDIKQKYNDTNMDNELDEELNEEVNEEVNEEEEQDSVIYTDTESEYCFSETDENDIENVNIKLSIDNTMKKSLCTLKNIQYDNIEYAKKYIVE